MFECHSKNLVEFVDKKGVPQRKTQEETMSDIVLYIQDHSDFYEAWENVFRVYFPINRKTRMARDTKLLKQLGSMTYQML